VYHAVGTGALTVVGNSAVIVNDDDVVIVDDHVSPAAAHVLTRGSEAAEPEADRHVINTHFHFDHAHGNQVFGPRGHHRARVHAPDADRQPSVGMPLFQNYLKGLPDAIADVRARVAAEKDPAARQSCARSWSRPRTTWRRRRSSGPSRRTSRSRRR
jgi:glyoxylase-like metal-dependent hydrolase (beta-lactamase superfamily II)